MKPLSVKAFRSLTALLFLLPSAGWGPIQAAPPAELRSEAAPVTESRSFFPRPPAKNAMAAYVSPATVIILDDAEIGISAGLEYTRRIRGRWLWGMNLAYTRIYGSNRYDLYPGTGDFSEERHMTRFTANAYYELPVTSRISLRFGTGVGVGWHLGEMYSDRRPGDSRFMPYLYFDITWVLRLGKHLIMELSPLIVGPSWVAWSPFKFDPEYSYRPVLFDIGLTLRLGADF